MPPDISVERLHVYVVALVVPVITPYKAFPAPASYIFIPMFIQLGLTPVQGAPGAVSTKVTLFPAIRVPVMVVPVAVLPVSLISIKSSNCKSIKSLANGSADVTTLSRETPYNDSPEYSTDTVPD